MPRASSTRRWGGSRGSARENAPRQGAAGACAVSSGSKGKPGGLCALPGTRLGGDAPGVALPGRRLARSSLPLGKLEPFVPPASVCRVDLLNEPRADPARPGRGICPTWGWVETRNGARDKKAVPWSLRTDRRPPRWAPPRCPKSGL